MTHLICVSVLFTAMVAAHPASAQVAGELGAPNAAGSREVVIQVRSEQHATLHRAESGARLCQAPCEVRLVPGVHHFGLSLGDSEMQVADPVAIPAAGTLNARYQRRSGSRTTGWVLTIIGGAAAIGGAILGGVMVTSGDMLGAPAGFGVLALAGLHLILALGAGLPLMLAGDGASLSFD
jgi:hypothetical protein